MKDFLEERLKSIKILIVDDAPENLRTLTRILRETNYHVTTANSGEEALEIIRSNRPDLILLDVKMPGIDGFEVCKRVKADSQTISIPIIFISALDQIEDKKKGFELGASDYILKPFQDEEVILRINNILKISIL